MRHLLFSIVIGFIVFVGYLLYYLGIYKSVEVTEAVHGPYKMIYTEHVGAYHRIVAHIEKVEKWAKANQVQCEESFGEYIDDPKIVDQERLRSNAGCMVKEIPSQLPDDFKFKEYPQKKFVVARFQGAPSIGPLKVYPKAQDYMAEKNYKQTGGTLEIYRILGPNEMETKFLFPIE